MAINKKLISFATQAQFNAFLANGDIDTRSVVFIEDTQRIWSHGKFFDTSWSYITGKPTTFTPSEHTLDSHSNVTITANSSGEILKWNGTQWINNTLDEADIVSKSTTQTITGLKTLAAATSGTLLSRTGYSDFIGYNPTYGSYLGGGIANAAGGIFAGGFISNSSGVHTIYHTGNLNLGNYTPYLKLTGSTPATAGWYRIATSSSGIANCNGRFDIVGAASGIHSLVTVEASISYGMQPDLTVVNNSHYSAQAINQVRIVYHNSYTSNYAYLEIYSPNAAVISFNYSLINSSGWSLIPIVAGSIPSGYTSFTVPVTRNLITANISGNAGTATTLQTARTIGLSGVTSTAQSFNGSTNIIIPITAIPATLLTGTASINTTGNAATATNISNSGTVTLATATESNAITITQPSYVSGKPVKLLNFNWYATTWSLGNIRGGSTDTQGLGVYLDGTEMFRFRETGAFLIGGNTAWHSGNFTPGDYLPLSGGTLTGSSYNILELKRSSANGSSILFSNSSVNLGKIGFIANGNLIIGAGTTTDGTANMLSITSSGVAQFYGNISTSGLVTGTGFSKTGATDAHILLGNGGHKSISDFNASLITSTSATGTSNVATTNTNTFLNIVQGGSSIGSSTQIQGTGAIAISSDTAGKLIIHSDPYSIGITDNRGAERLPNYYPEKRLSTFFNLEIPTRGGRWSSGINVKGWGDGYKVWQLFADSHIDSNDHNLYFRTGINSAWNAIQTVWTDRNFNPSNYSLTTHTHNYLPLTGGTLTGVLGVQDKGSHRTLIYNSVTAGEAIFGVSPSGTNTASSYIRLGSSSFQYNNSVTSYDIWHAGNLSPVTTARTVTAGNGLTGGGALSSNLTLTLGTPSDITATSTNSVTATSHTHNLVMGSGSGLDADLLDGYHSTRFALQGAPILSTDFLVWDGATLFGLRTWAPSTPNYPGDAYGTALDFRDTNTWYHRLAFGVSGRIRYYSGINTTTLTKRGDLAFITDNVASATKLQTARTLTIGNTGKTFDGSANVAWSAAEMGVLPLTGGTMANTNLVTNLNADLLDGLHGTDYSRMSSNLPVSHVGYNTNWVGRSGNVNDVRGSNQIPYVISNHTGISLSAHSVYQGVRLWIQQAGTPYAHDGTLTAQFSTNIDLYRPVTAHNGITATGNLLTSANLIANTGITIAQTGAAGVGLSLYGTAGVDNSTNPMYGIMFATTASKGTHGAVTGTHATYFTMSNTAGRGWIFTTDPAGTTGNVASISNTGIATFTSISLGGSSTNILLANGGTKAISDFALNTDFASLIDLINGTVI